MLLSFQLLPDASFTDPFTLRAWAGIALEGLPDLSAQVRLMGEQVLPEISSL
jgi:hypothetical protein